MAGQLEPSPNPPAWPSWPDAQDASLAERLSRQGAALPDEAGFTAQRLAILGEKTACLVHEIKNPLMAIGGFARRLVDSPRLDDDERAKVALIAREALRLEQLLSGALAFARPRQGETAELLSLAAECLELMRLGSEGVRYEARGVGPLVALAPPDLVRQCLINLIKNAAEAVAANPGGRGTVSVSVSREGRWVLLRVADDGAGMSREQLARVFTPFSTTKAHGTGLGLAHTRRMVEDLGGSLTLQSAPGLGTVATLVLPAAERGNLLPGG